jgi:hypothetical protein
MIAKPRGWVLVAVALCALPAQGAGPTLPGVVVSVLTPIDTVPSRAALDHAFAPGLALVGLIGLASDETVDLGIQLRAIRALPSYCPPTAGTCGPETPSHDTLVRLIERYRDASDPVQAPRNILRLRAAAEALGATRSGLPEDVDVLLTLLGQSEPTDPDGDTPIVPGHPSLDVRAAAARAIGQLCNHDARLLLFPHLSDPSPQVVTQVSDALARLELCTK